MLKKDLICLKENLYIFKKIIFKTIRNIHEFIFNTSDFIVSLNQKENFRYAHFIPDKFFLKCWYKHKTGEELNLKNPKKLNEKLQWLKLYDKKDLYKTIVDKHKMKDYIESKIGSGYTVKTIGLWDKFEDIDFSALPNSFVLKCTHDSGSVVVCKDKSNLDIKKAKQKLEYCLNKNYFWKYREWPYKCLKPKIICEEYLDQVGSEGLIDYKFYCFSGEPKYFMVSIGEAMRSAKNHKFDMELNSIDHLFKAKPTLSLDEINLPDNIGDMISIVEILCKGFAHIRVDLYNVEGQIYVGELTLYSNAGMLRIASKEYAQQLADCIDLTI